MIAHTFFSFNHTKLLRARLPHCFRKDSVENWQGWRTNGIRLNLAVEGILVSLAGYRGAAGR